MEIVFCSLVIFFIMLFFVVFVNVSVKLESSEEKAFQSLIELADKERTKVEKKKDSRKKYKRFTNR